MAEQQTATTRNILKLSDDGTHGYCPSCHERFGLESFRKDWTPTKRAQARGLRGALDGKTTWHECQGGESR